MFPAIGFAKATILHSRIDQVAGRTQDREVLELAGVLRAVLNELCPPAARP